MPHSLFDRYPELAHRLPRIALATLPTPVGTVAFDTRGSRHTLTVKYDNLSAGLYGGNKVRKLEYLLARAQERNVRRIATFGTVASHHALATALFARQQGFACSCFLSHQARSSDAPRALNLHLRTGTEIIRFGGDYGTRLATLRRHLHGRAVAVVPMGGSSWLGTVGFVNAGLELAAQIEAGEIQRPGKVYIAFGTMGSAAGLALGVALAGLDIPIEAVRVAHPRVANRKGLGRLMAKTATLLKRLAPSIPADLAGRTCVRVRDEFFGPGYARSDQTTDRAIAFAKEHLDLVLEPTYTGKTMAALLADLARERQREPPLFWHTYHGQALWADAARPAPSAQLPDEFMTYYD